MLDIWKEVERSEQAVADAETDDDYARALKDLEDVLRRYTERVQECIEHVSKQSTDLADSERPAR